MNSRRMAKVAQAIRQVVSSSVLVELRDPRVKHVTVLGIEVAPDLRSARVRLTVLGGEKTQRLALQGLQSARGFLQSRIADELQLRHTPLLTFVLDQGVKKSVEVSRLLREVEEERPSADVLESEEPADPDLAPPPADDDSEHET